MTTVFSASLLFMTMLASGSDDSGKAIASAYYLPLYLREQSRTVVD